MGSNPATGLTCRPKGLPERVSGSERFRYQSESDIGPTMKSLSRLCSRNEDERAAALEELSQGVLLCLGLDGTSPARLGKETLLHLLRLSCSCPLREVRERAAELLRTAQVRRGEARKTHNSGTFDNFNGSLDPYKLFGLDNHILDRLASADAHFKRRFLGVSSDVRPREVTQDRRRTRPLSVS